MQFLSDDNTNSEFFIPPVPCNFRNNCQEGRWYFDSQEYGGTGSEFLFFAFAPYFGDLGATQNGNWGQVWGYPLSPDMPPLVFVTYLKTSGLQSFCNQWNLISCQTEKNPDGTIIKGPDGRPVKKNPARYVWRSQFKKETKTLPDGKKGNYYLLLWEVEELKKGTERYLLAEQVEAEMRANLPRLVDNQGTANMVRLLGMDESQKDAAIAQFKQAKQKQLTAAK